MGIKLSELEEGSAIALIVSKDDNTIALDANIIKIARDDMALISIDHPSGKRLNFDGVKIDLEFGQDEDVPVLWREVRVAQYKSDYVVQTTVDGVRHNRRGCFRVGVSMRAQLRVMGKGASTVMVRDVSLSGFSITDRKKELKFDIGEKVPVKFEDLGYTLDLVGRVVRVEEHEDMLIYGLEITNLCKDLSSYVSVKQRRNRQR